jgi:hypothetical protein
MIVDNGSRARLVVPGVFDGIAGVMGSELAFIPTGAMKADGVRVGLLDGKPVSLNIRRGEGGFYIAQWGEL